MKKKYYLFISLSIFSFIGCQKDSSLVSDNTDEGAAPIVFSLNDGFSVDLVETKAVTEVSTSNLTSFNVSATTGTSGSEVNKWNNISFAKSGSNFTASGYYWPATDQSYHFYASNAALTFNAGGCTVSPDGTVDVVCAYLASPTYKANNALTFNHIYSRIGSLSLTSSDSNFTVSNVTWTLKSAKTSGTYNLRTGTWTPGTGADKTLSASPDILILPGTYTLQCSYNVKDKNSNYTKNFTKTASITLVAGKKYTITGTGTNDATAITFTATVTAWSSATLTPTF